MPHDPFHRASWRVLRLGALVIGTPIALVSVTAMGLLWRLSLGPLDITRLADRFSPVVIQKGVDQAHPAGRLVCQRLLLSWQPGLNHFHPELGLEARDLRILRQDGSATLALGHVALGVRMGPLWRGHIEPTRLSVSDGRIITSRQSDGSVDLDFIDARHGGSKPLPVTFIHLHDIALNHVDVMLRHAIPPHDGNASSHAISVDVQHAALTRPANAGLLGWNGAIDGYAIPGQAPVIPFRITATTVDRKVTWQLHGDDLVPDRLDGLVPYAGDWHLPARIGAVFTTSSGSARHPLPDLSSLTTQSEGRIALSFGAGKIDQKNAGTLSVADGHLVVPFQLVDGHLSIPGAEADIGLIDDQGRTSHFSTQASVDADSALKAKHIAGHVALSATTLDVAHLAAIWPQFLMKGARRWVTHNMTAGTGEGLHIDASLGGDAGWDSVRPTHVDASFQVEHATVHWLRPVPPAQDVSARFSFPSPDTLAIEFLHGLQLSGDRPSAGPIHLDGGSMLIKDLYAKDQTGVIALDLSCDLGDCARLLAHPRLHLLSRHPLPFTHLSGAVSVHDVLSLPLSSHIENDQIHVDATARFRHVTLGNVVLGRDLTEASGTLAATEKNLNLTGEGLLGGVPTRASFEENFISRAGGVRETVHAVSDFDEAALDRAQISNHGLFKGQAKLVTDYRAGFNGRADVRLALDLTDSVLTIPVWHKDASRAASASAHIGLRNGSIVTLDSVEAEGPDLHVMGSGRIADGHVRAIVLDGFEVGRSRGDAVVELPSSETAPVNVHVHAQDLDLSPLFHHEGGSSPSVLSGKEAGQTRTRAGDKPGQSAKAAHGLDWSVDLATDRLFYGPQKYFARVTAHLEHRNDRLDRARITAMRPVGVVVDLSPHVDGRHLDLRIDNLGTFLTETGMTTRLYGGTARVKGRVGDGGTGSLPPFEGTITVSPFTFRQPPAALTAATHLSVFNWSQASHDRFEVQHLYLPVRVSNDIMTIHEGHLGNPALGATLEGRIGLDKGTLDLRGTVVPVFGLNAAPGRLPNVGKLFSPEKGGGVLAATFTVKGDAGNPELSVNPFAMLLPGVMRQLAK